MQPTQSASRNALKYTVYIAGGLILVTTIALGVVYFLKNVIPKATNSLTPTQVTAASPNEVIEAVKNPETIKDLSDKYLLQNSDTTTHVVYRGGNRNYTVSTPTKLQAMYSAKNGKDAGDLQKIQDQITTFMQSKGYDKINNTGTATSENPSYLTYASTGAVCQLTTSKPAEGAPTLLPYVAVACVEKGTVDQEYTAIDTLLTIYKQTQALPDFSEIIRTTKTDADKSMAILSLSGGQDTPSLLFAAIDDNWTYIGNLNGSGATNGKYTITPEMRTRINDPKYGDFLKKNLQ